MIPTSNPRGSSIAPAAPDIVDGPFSHNINPSFDAKQPATQFPIIQSDRVSHELGARCGMRGQSGKTLDGPSARCGFQKLADDTGGPASRHPAFSRHSRGQAWARCNSAPGPGPAPAPLSFCWQQGHLPDIYQHTSLSPSRLMAQVHRGGQGAKGCLAW